MTYLNELKSVKPTSRLLLVAASSPSDMVEMKELAIKMVNQGHRVVFGLIGEFTSAEDLEASLKKGLNTAITRLEVRVIGLPNLNSIVYLLKNKISQFKNRNFFFRFLILLKPLVANKVFKFFYDNLIEPLLKVFYFFISAIYFCTKNINSFKDIKFFPSEIRFKGLLKIISPLLIIFELRYVVFYIANLVVFRTELQRQVYDAILIPEDVVGSVWPLLIKATNQMKIPSIIFPYTLADQSEAIKSLSFQEAYQQGNNKLASYFFPKWCWNGEGVEIIRLPSGHVFAHNFLDISPPDPWLMNSGFASAICVDSNASYNYFKNAGIPSDRLHITGSVSQDNLFNASFLKSENLVKLRQKLRITEDKPILLISGCPNQLEGIVPSCEFSSMDQIATFIGLTLRVLSPHYHIVVRPHPNYMIFGEMLTEWGIVKTDIPTSELVPLADIFIAFASATIRWSVTCAVPTINYDIFNYCYTDFSNIDGVVNVTSATDFERTVDSLKPDGILLKSLKSQIEANSKHWGNLDGKSVERIESVIEGLCTQIPSQ